MRLLNITVKRLGAIFATVYLKTRDCEQTDVLAPFASQECYPHAPFWERFTPDFAFNGGMQ